MKRATFTRAVSLALVAACGADIAATDRGGSGGTGGSPDAGALQQSPTDAAPDAGSRPDARDASLAIKDAAVDMRAVDVPAEHLPRSDTPPPNGGLVLHWAFDDASGTTVKDSSGNGLDGTLMVANGGSLPPWAMGNGMKGGALDLNRMLDDSDTGSYQYQWAELPHSRTNGALDVGPDDDFSISIWINRSGDMNGDSFCFVSKLLSAGVPGKPYVQPPGYRIQLRADAYNHTLATWVSDGDRTLFVGAPSRAETKIPKNSGWHHLVFVFDHHTLENSRWYLDGEDTGAEQLEWYVVNDAEATRRGTIPAGSLANTYPLTVGRRSAGNAEAPFKGMVDELRIYNRTLTSAEVRALYENP